MNSLIKLKHWQIFCIMTICYLLIFVFQENEFTIGNISSFEFAIALSILSLILFFMWLLIIGIFLNSIPENPYRFRKGILIFAICCIIIGYSDLNLKRLGLESGFIPLWYTFLSTPLTFWGIVYTFFKISKSLKSLELGREVKFSECILDAFLLFAYPIGVWFIQPKLNKIYTVCELTKNEME